MSLSDIGHIDVEQGEFVISAGHNAYYCFRYSYDEMKGEQIEYVGLWVDGEMNKNEDLPDGLRGQLRGTRTRLLGLN